jgi:hypothetical protein
MGIGKRETVGKTSGIKRKNKRKRCGCSRWDVFFFGLP